MTLATIKIGHLSVSRLILGGNPFSGFSHQSPAQDVSMRHYYTTDRIKETLREAERLGINCHISRADHHVMRYLVEHWDEGGRIQWLAQTCPEVGTVIRGVENAIGGGAKACHLHGGMMDNLLASHRLEDVPAALAKIRQAGLAAGIAGHKPAVFEWAEKNVDVDYYMCSYYNPTPRDTHAEHRSELTEDFDPANREAMVRTIAGLRRPVIHYKVLAAGRNDPREALEFVARNLRPQDAVCLGVFTKDAPAQLAEDLRLLEEAIQKVGK